MVVGFDLDGTDEAVLRFAFDAASRRAAALRVVHGRRPGGAAASPADTGLDTGAAQHAGEPLTDVLRPWQEKFPDVTVTEQAVIGRAASHLVDVSRDACLVVVGRTARHAALGAHIGPVTDALVRRAVAPVAVVPHE
ncbi:hypothetical protein GCM10010503_19310 [Streptomyces lucensis JCM 4490]|uniref:UspA domain-containing protein n=1 Tax=Streptomyces lucensis JCM 4490 TaxID=1306176 RepID=A0A918MPZ2_9ACTN|nr:universal stress protein [Streptomyces lucensis]GGW42917.1 hypothetical protein GCM10010503_19310 [Streptomyces lucensis JCM 4490]